jgi:hypothetical protein
MHGTFIPSNRPLLLVDPWGHYLVDPNMLYVGWDGPVLAGGPSLSTLRQRGKWIAAVAVQDSRTL